MQYFEEKGSFLGNGTIPITNFKSKDTGLSVYFADLDSPVINGYFCFGVDQPEGTGIESLLWHLDSSGGLFPRTMRSDIVRPTWQHHGAENPLADRDQSSYVTSALGEAAFLGTFNCAVYLLQNLEAVFDIHGYPTQSVLKKEEKEGAENTASKAVKEGGEPGLQETQERTTENDENDNEKDKDSELEMDPEREPKLDSREYYFLSESGEGAMAWEATLQNLFPGVRAFWNRLLSDLKSRVSAKMRECYDNFYRPSNLTVIITGTIKDRKTVLETLRDYEEDFRTTRGENCQCPPAWSEPLPVPTEAIVSECRFVPRMVNREPLATICFGWRGCNSYDVETAMALKVFTAHAAVGPIWNEFVTNSQAHRISWCQLEYVENCSLVTIHGITKEEDVEAVMEGTAKILARLGEAGDDLLDLNELRGMVNRVGWHYVRELESDPYLILAAAISKGDRYGRGDPEQIQKRVHPRLVFDALAAKPVEYWKNLARIYFNKERTFATKVIPRSYDKDNLNVLAGFVPPPPTAQAEESAEQPFVRSSRRASSRPRRRSSSVVQDRSRSTADISEDCVNNNAEATEEAVGKVEDPEPEVTALGRLEQISMLEPAPFPLGSTQEDADQFESKLGMTKEFLDQVRKANLLHYNLTNFQTEGEQHPNFPLADLPYYTFLEDTETSFIYFTFVIDTTHLDDEERKLVAPITAALGAVLCPRPPGLDTDAEITNPTEFNPPQLISDSQVSLGLNGELTQSIFATIIIRPEHYEWAVGMYHFLLFKMEFTDTFLQFISAEAAKGLACSYKLQTAEVPNYDCFDSGEINLHSAVKQIYKKESNARLFVGRRRLDLVNEYSAALKSNGTEVAAKTNATWRKLVNEGRICVQIAANLAELTKAFPEPTKCWKTYFGNIQRSKTFADSQPRVERDMMNSPCGQGVRVSAAFLRQNCFSVVIPLNPAEGDFAKLCFAAQMFSMAQKWVWNCMDEEDSPCAVLRMPCAHSNILTLNLESTDVIGSILLLKKIFDPNWPWLKNLMIATKLMIVNDPASVEMGPQGTIATTLLSHLNNEPRTYRRDLVMESLQVTLEDIQRIIKEYMVNFFNPEKCWYSLMTYGEDGERVAARLEGLGFKFVKSTITEVCTTL